MTHHLNPTPVTATPGKGVDATMDDAAVFSPEVAPSAAAREEAPDGGEGPHWETDLKPTATPRTLPAAPVVEAGHRSVSFTHALKQGLLAAGLILAPMAAEAGVPTEPNPIVAVANAEQVHGHRDLAKEAWALKPGQSLQVPAGTTVKAGDFREAGDHHYQITSTGAGLEVQRLASDPDGSMTPLEKGISAVAAMLLAFSASMLGMDFYDKRTGNRQGQTFIAALDAVEDKIADLKALLARILPRHPQPKGY
jgi:hypothetical protein